MSYLGSHIAFRVGEVVDLHHGELIPAVIVSMSEDKRRVELRVIGDKKSRPWVGTHWYSTSDISHQ